MALVVSCQFNLSIFYDVLNLITYIMFHVRSIHCWMPKMSDENFFLQANMKVLRRKKKKTKCLTPI